MNQLEASYNNVARGSVFLIVDNSVTAIIGVVFWFLVAKMLPSYEVGQAATVLALGGTAAIFSSLGIQVAVSKFMSEGIAKGNYDRAKMVLRTTILLTVISSSVVAAGLGVSSGFLASNYRQPALIPLILISAVALPFQTLYALIKNSFQGRLEMHLCPIQTGVFQGVRIALVLLLILLGLGATGVVLGSSIGFVVALIIGLLFLTPRSLIRGNAKAQEENMSRKILRFSLPNYGSSIMATFNTQVPLLILGVYNLRSVAYYNVVLLISSVLLGVAGSISGSLLPSISAYQSNGGTEIRIFLNKVSRVGLVVTGPIFALVGLNGSIVLSNISPEYVIGTTPLQILMLSGIVGTTGILFNGFLNGVGDANKAMLVTATSAITGLVLSFILIPNYGMMGAAYSALVAAVLLSTMGALVVKAKHRIRLAIGTITPFLLSMGGFGVSFLAMRVYDSHVLGTMVFVGIYIAGTFAFKSISKSEILSLIPFQRRTPHS